MLAREFLNVTVKMLWADLVESAFVGAFQHRPETLNSVRMHHVAHVFGNRVLYCLVLERHPFIGAVIIGVDLGIGRNMVRDEALQGCGIGIGNNTSRDPIAVAVFHTDHGSLSNRATSGTRQLFFLCLTHVLALAAKVSLVYFDRPVERSAVLARPRFPDTVEHEPSCRLGYADIAGQLHAGDALKAGKAQVDGDGPFAERDVGPRNRGAGADAEIGPTICAPVWHRFGVRDFLRPRAAALPAMALALPDHIFKPLGGRFLGREHVNQLNDGNTFAVRFAGCLFGHFHSPCHDGDMVTENTNVK